MQLRYQGNAWQVDGRLDLSPNQPEPRVTQRHAEFAESATAMGTALMRAAHTRLDPAPLIDDAWGDRLVPESVRAGIRDAAMVRLRAEGATPPPTPEAILDTTLLSASAFTNVILRARYCEDALRAAIGRGAQQYVVIGAGFDSFGLRAPAFARDVTIFEIDRAATQTLKRRRIAECGFSVLPSVHFITADLGKDPLAEVLAGGGYQSHAPGFYSWLGVTMFLTREACLATLRAIARSSAAGSELVFTYFDQQIFRSPSDRFRSMQAYVQSVGEPFQSGFDSGGLSQTLRHLGLDLVEDLSETELVTRYARLDDRSMRPLEHSRIALARVSDGR